MKAKKESLGKRLKRDILYNKYVYIMAVPVILYYIIFCYVPMGGLIIAFQDYKPALGLLGSKWEGLDNFIQFFTSINAGRVIRNTLLINIYDILFGFPAPIILALLINEVRSNRFKRTIQTLSYMPHFISLVVICSMLLEFSNSTGLFNDILAFFGAERSNLMMRNDLFRPMFVGSGIWQEVGWGSIVYLAALSGIDPTLYEAARMDGAGRFHQMRYITLPSLMPTILVLFIMRMGHIMSQGFEKVILLYTPLTYETGDVIASFVYRMGLQQTDYSFGAAVGLFNSIINFAILIIANRLSKKISGTGLW